MDIKHWFAISLSGYLILIFWIALRGKAQIEELEDYIVAGRSMTFFMASATLFGTWFGAGTLLAAADEISNVGLSAMAIEPIGAGLCLVLAGFLLAKPLWNANLLTLADFYRVRFGSKAEFMFSFSTFTYFGWIAAQLVGVAGILNVFFEAPIWLGIICTASVATAYTMLGGMWSVAKTDAIQIGLLILGLMVLSGCVIVEFGSLSSLWNKLPESKKVVIPTQDLKAFMGWSNLLLIGMLGNLPGSDLMQRVFAAKNADIAKKACITAGCAYLILGTLPVMMGLYGSVHLAHGELNQIISKLIAHISHGSQLGLWIKPVMVITLLALISAVLSTLDSAMLTTASVIVQNIIIPRKKLAEPIKAVRYCVVLVGAVSVCFAFAGRSAFELIEGSYAMTMAGPLAPLVLGVYFKFGGEWAATVSLTLGYLTIFIETVASFVAPALFEGWIVPLPFVALCLSTCSYLVVGYLETRSATE
ncbi:MAG: sodium:solute symporter [Myxococcota bacterium]|nr:sodium:solute symporter [Myxococcota bacterium]